MLYLFLSSSFLSKELIHGSYIMWKSQSNLGEGAKHCQCASYCQFAQLNSIVQLITHLLLVFLSVWLFNRKVKLIIAATMS